MGLGGSEGFPWGGGGEGPHWGEGLCSFGHRCYFYREESVEGLGSERGLGGCDGQGRPLPSVWKASPQAFLFRPHLHPPPFRVIFFPGFSGSLSLRTSWGPGLQAHKSQCSCRTTSRTPTPRGNAGQLFVPRRKSFRLHFLVEEETTSVPCG